MVFYRVGPGPRIGMEGLAPTSGANIETMTQQLNQPASSYSVSSPGPSTTGLGTGSGSGAGTGTGSSSGQSNKGPVSGLGTGSSYSSASSYSASRIMTTPTSMASPQTVAPQPSMAVPQVTETTTPTGVAHLWIGWKVEPMEEEFIKRFIEAFEHGEHVGEHGRRGGPPIMLPMMGGVLAPIPGTPAPGAPVVTMQPQGAGNQQLTV